MIHISTLRIACPKDATYCEDQAPVPAGIVVAMQLYSWFEWQTRIQGASGNCTWNRSCFSKC